MSETYLVYWKAKDGKERSIRIDSELGTAEDAKNIFKKLYPRKKVERIVLATHLVRNLGLSCY